MFYVGQKVVCIDDGEQTQLGDRVEVGQIYIIQEFYIIWIEDNRCAVLLQGLRRNHMLFGDGWSINRFRPLQEKKTDISIFKALLNPVKQDELV